METTLYSTFLDDKEIAYQIYEMLANDILGKEQLEKIKLRYDDMYRNFFNYPKEEARKLIKSGTEACVWEFSKGVEPFTPKGWNRYYEDTITVPIPITHPDFKDLTTRTEKRGAIGLDLPTWFNLKILTSGLCLWHKIHCEAIHGIPMLINSPREKLGAKKIISA